MSDGTIVVPSDNYQPTDAEIRQVGTAIGVGAFSPLLELIIMRIRYKMLRDQYVGLVTTDKQTLELEREYDVARRR